LFAWVIVATARGLERWDEELLEMIGPILPK
jgi:hypothetical protein